MEFILPDLPDDIFQRVLGCLSSRDVANVARAGPRTAAMVRPSSYTRVMLSRTNNARHAADALCGGACEMLELELRGMLDQNTDTSPAMIAVLDLATTRPEAVRRIAHIVLRLPVPEDDPDIIGVTDLLTRFLSRALFPALRELCVDRGVLTSDDIIPLADARLTCDEVVLMATELPALGAKHMHHVEVILDTVHSRAFRIAADNGLRINTLNIVEIDGVDNLTSARVRKMRDHIKKIASTFRVMSMTASTPHLRFMHACMEAGGAAARLTMEKNDSFGTDHFLFSLSETF